MEHVIDVEPRSAGNKSDARKCRAKGKIPGVLYGAKKKPRPFAVDPINLQRTVSTSGLGRNTVLTVKGLEESVLALLKDTQVDPVKRKLIHIDLIEIREDQEVAVDVPVEVTGK